MVPGFFVVSSAVSKDCFGLVETFTQTQSDLKPRLLNTLRPKSLTMQKEPGGGGRVANVSGTMALAGVGLEKQHSSPKA